MATVVVAVSDVFFLAKVHDAVKQAGAELKLARTVEEGLAAAWAGADMVVVDLNDQGLAALELVGALRAEEAFGELPIVGFLSHVQVDLKAQAEEAGVTEVVARSVFSAKLPEILGRYVG